MLRFWNNILQAELFPEVFRSRRRYQKSRLELGGDRVADGLCIEALLRFCCLTGGLEFDPATIGVG